VVAALVLFLLSVRRFKAAGTPLPGNKPTLGRYGVEPGQTVKVTTRRGSIELNARADRYVQEGTIFIPFAYVEAATNVLTNPQLDPRVQILRSEDPSPLTARNVPRSSSVGT
jgi:anaerobic selenocysteine-containing dehydrogenase